MIPGKSLHFLNSGYSNQERHRRRAGELLVEIHPDDARTRSLETGTAVRVWNNRAIAVTGQMQQMTDAGGAKRSVGRDLARVVPK